VNLTSEQQKTVLAAFLGWTLDAFDFFLLVFLLGDIAKEFGVDVSDVSYALFLTLAMRFVGAFVFGRLGDRFGRKPILMLDIVSYSVVGGPRRLRAYVMDVPLVARAVRRRDGRRMGPRQFAGDGIDTAAGARRGVRHAAMRLSQPAICSPLSPYGLIYQRSFGGLTIGWRAMFLLSFLPALVVLFIRSHVPESPAFAVLRGPPKPKLIATLRANWGIALYAVVLMMCFNLFSHGTQDLYPTFLQKAASVRPYPPSVGYELVDVALDVGLMRADGS